MTNPTRLPGEDTSLDPSSDLHFALKAARLGIWKFDPATRQIDWDDQCRELFGMTRNEPITYEAATRHIHPADLARFNETFRWGQNVQAERTCDFTLRVLETDTRRLRWIRLIGQTRFSGNDGITQWVGIAQEMTQTVTDGQWNEPLPNGRQLRGQVEQTLPRHEMRQDFLVRLIDTVPAIIWITEPDGYCNYLNKRWYEFTGQLATEAEGYGWLDATHPDDRDEAARLFQEANEKQIPFSFLYRLRHKDGTYRWAVDTAAPRFSADGAYMGMAGTVVDVTGQILAQQELARNQTYLQTALSVADLGTFSVDVATNTSTYSENVRRWFGLPAVHGPMETILSKIHADDLPLVQRVIREALQSEAHSHHDITYRVVNPVEGGIIYIRSFGKAQYVDGKPVSIIGALQNVTEQMLIRQQIEASEQNLRSLVESAPFPIGVYIGREMRIKLVNQSILDAWGKGPDIVGRLFSEVLPELADQGIYKQLDDVYMTGVPFRARNRRVDLWIDGQLQTYYFNYDYMPLYDADGQIYGVMNTAADVTDLILAKQQVEQTEATLRGAIELAQLATWSVDIRKNTITYSPRFMGWLGFSEATKNLDEAYESLPDEDRRAIIEVVDEVIRPGASGHYENEHPVVNRLTGEVRIMHARAQVQYDADGNPAFLSGTAQDVTEQRRVQHDLERLVQERTQQLQASVQDLRRSNENLKQFAYVASHDLQEPLRKIQSFSDILVSQYADQLGEGITFLERMRSAAGRMSMLIKDLLTYSRISTRRETIATVSLNDVMDGVLTTLDLLIGETSAVIELDNLPEVQGEPSQLGQLFQNLLSNALKFRKPDVAPVIQIRVEPVAAGNLPPTVKPTQTAAFYHRIDVVDNGIGFDEKYVGRIFQVFQRLHGKNQYGGTGIGLAISEKVAANHGGAITATSRPGQGATFSVYLPAWTE